MVSFDSRHNFLFFVRTEVYAYLKPFLCLECMAYSVMRFGLLQVRRQHLAPPRGTTELCTAKVSHQKSRQLVYRAADVVFYAETPLVRFAELLCPQHVT